MKTNFLEPDHMLFRTSNIAKFDGPVTFLLYELEFFFLNWRGYRL